MKQLNLLDYYKTPLKIDKPIRLIELFAGIGSQAKALQSLGADFEHYRTSEWEWNAVASYKAIHKGENSTNYSVQFTKEELTNKLLGLGISSDGKKPMTREQIARKNEQWHRDVYNSFKGTNNVGSIVNVSAEDLGIVDTNKYCYILTYSFPCQDLSLAGKQKGMAKGTNTRSSMLWEVERLLNECNELPQVLLMENVTQVHGKNNKEHFDEWIAFLESKGYSNYWQDLNAKNLGIPQNRDRTFMVSVLGDYTYEFPKEFPLELRLKDMLEAEVDKKYYLSTKGTIKDGKPFVAVKEATKKGYAEAVEGDSINLEQPNSKTRRGRVGHGVAQTLTTAPQQAVVEPQVLRQIRTEYGKEIRKKYESGEIKEKWGNIKQFEPRNDGIANTLSTVQKDNYLVEPLALDEQNRYVRKDGCVGTLTTDGSSPKHNNRVIQTNLKIRKLTPKECWRLMGFDDADFEKAAAVNSNSQLYKQAGNSIVVDVLYYIFRQMLP